MNILPCGDRAVLIECDTLHEAQTWFAALREHAEVVLGARTVLVRGDLRASRELIDRTDPSASPVDTGHVVEISVTYDGADLAEVADLTGLTADGVVEAHTGTAWTVAFGGFAPGFAYLVGGDPRLHVPRRSSPRTRVPAGSVGLAGEFSGVYPRESPGGWQLIGRTTLRMWDVDREPPALLVAGTTVRFVAR
ncbi:5-oxoprolinase subunit B family protein [Aeromicrobium fastidiosum]|uniref:Allophanate hydrolase subunit 1 n=1 Tax=Aeromicrobium fastidiosum TaxID=52699 RepID=A0A641ALS2_9ACTN|nr:allophanate hydrolase subunit 1 [Aeromicrobium fastidiosum]KAA1374661.1 allophanate hydrolase subunit 1 [Aeromicrobium fastidiosum]MBP2390793.1 KipI family sensor histidine kinase inhibitor [Aeromicrobium fastidiosum]